MYINYRIQEDLECCSNCEHRVLDASNVNIACGKRSCATVDYVGKCEQYDKLKIKFEHMK